MKIILATVLMLISTFLMPLTVNAEDYTFDMSNVMIENEIEQFSDAIPQSIRDKTTEISADMAEEAAEKYDFNFFLQEIISSAKDNLPSAISLFASISAIIIITAVFEKLSAAFSIGDCSKAYQFCSALCIVLSVYTVKNSSYTVAVTLLKTLCSIMTIMVPLMEAIYISAGNASLAQVSGTALTITLTVIETVYSKIMIPAVSVSFILSSVSAATGNSGIAYLSKTLRGMLTTAIVLIMSMTSIILSLQSGIAASADKFSARAIRFALGSYIPLVGGSLSESLSALTGSLGIIKQIAGTTGIVVIVLMLIPPLISLLMTRISLYLTSALSGMIGCEKTKSLLDEIGGTYTMLISIALSASLVFIYALSVFCKAPLAID